MINPDSFEESSRQARLIWLAEAEEAERLEGAVGRAGLAACTYPAKMKLRASNRNIRSGTSAAEVPSITRRTTWSSHNNAFGCLVIFFSSVSIAYYFKAGRLIPTEPTARAVNGGMQLACQNHVLLMDSGLGILSNKNENACTFSCHAHGGKLVTDLALSAESLNLS
jgi:hypothetical protein